MSRISLKLPFFIVIFNRSRGFNITRAFKKIKKQLLNKKSSALFLLMLFMAFLKSCLPY